MQIKTSPCIAEQKIRFVLYISDIIFGIVENPSGKTIDTLTERR